MAWQLKDRCIMFGYLRCDDDGHWYLIPENELQVFSKMVDDISNCDTWVKRDEFCDKFIEKFDKYRLSGGVEDLRISMQTIVK